MNSILSANRQANAQAQSEVITLKIEHQKALDAKDIEHRSALMLLKSQHASVITEKNAMIKQLQYASAETEALAGDMALEYGSLEMSVAEVAKANAAKELSWQRLPHPDSKRSNILMHCFSSRNMILQNNSKLLTRISSN